MISQDVSVVNFPFPLFSSYPVPREYSPNLSGRSTVKQGECVGDGFIFHIDILFFK